MTAALTVIAGIALCVSALALLLNYKTLHDVQQTLKESQDHTYREREQFLQRIQAPESATAIHAQEVLDESGVGVYTLPFDDDEAESEFERLTDGRDGPDS